MRQARPECSWSKGVWFTQSTPKFSFLVWVAIRNRLQTCDRMQVWNAGINTLCVLCQENQETCRHLFFQCRYSAKIWRTLVGGILKEAFTLIWDEIIEMIANPRSTMTEVFLIRYAFQALVHSIWRERNGRRHGEAPKDVRVLIKCVDRTIRLKLLAVKGMKNKYLEESLSTWFGSRLQDSI